jgi:hypothetical protein
MAKWFGYAAIFVVSVFVMDAILVLVALLAGMASAEAMRLTAGPFTIIIEIVLAALITYLIVRPRPEPVRDLEAKRKGEEYLLELARREAAEDQFHLDEDRLHDVQARLALWQQARELRAAAEEALAVLGDGDAQTADGKSMREELTWALRYADTIDPLRSRQTPAAD